MKDAGLVTARGLVASLEKGSVAEAGPETGGGTEAGAGAAVTAKRYTMGTRGKPVFFIIIIIFFIFIFFFFVLYPCLQCFLGHTYLMH